VVVAVAVLLEMVSRLVTEAGVETGIV